MNEIGVYECVIMYSDVLKVCYVFLGCCSLLMYICVQNKKNYE